MKHGSFKRSLKSRPRGSTTSLGRASTTVLAAILIASCDNKWDNPFKLHSIVVDREVLLDYVQISPNVVAKLPSGRLIIAGRRETAAVVLTDEYGRFIWQYEAPIDDQVKLPYKSEFTGVAHLANGDLLLCGSRFTRDNHEENLIGILDASTGHVNELTTITPDGDSHPHFDNSAFTSCVNRDEGHFTSWIRRGAWTTYPVVCAT